MALTFTTPAPGTSTGWRLEIVYRQPDDPDAKPPAIQHLDLALPNGTTFDGSAMPVCRATDTDLRVKGRLACPAKTHVGRGTIVVQTGCGAPFDPFAADVVVYNGGDHLIEHLFAKGTDVPVASARLMMRGDHVVVDVGRTPGCAPDLVTAVRSVDLLVEPHGAYFTTPATCPDGGAWRSTVLLGFTDGTTQTASSASPC